MAERSCAIEALLAKRISAGATNTRDTRQTVFRWLGRTPQLAVPGSVIFTKVRLNGHMQNRAAVTAAGLAALEVLYSAQFLKNVSKAQPHSPANGQSTLAFAAPTATPTAAPTEAVEQTIKASFSACLDNFSEARRNFDAAILQEAQRVCDPPKELEIKTVLKKLGLSRLNESRVGAKASQAYKRRFPGRELAKKKVQLTNGVEITANVWTTEEEALLRLAALQVYAAEQPNVV